MRKLLSAIRRFLSELGRRNVYRVAVTYIVVGFFVIEAADLTLTRLGLPSWSVTLVVVLVGLSFPIALVMAWALEVTPEGVRVEERVADDTDGSTEVPSPVSTTREVWAGASVLVLLLLGAWWMWGGLSSGSAGEKTENRAREVDERSIAVLPFEALGKEEPGIVTEGMHDALLTRLSNVSGLKVFSRQAVERYRNTDLSTRQIADSLGVRWVLEGGVQEMGNEIRVDAQLTDPRSQTNVWAEGYRRQLTAKSLFDLQAEITKRIARSLTETLTPEEKDRIERRPTENLEAYRLYIQGRRLLDQRGRESMQESVNLFRQVLREDSTYALAWAGLADVLALRDFYDFEVPDSVPTAETAARRAVELGPDLAEARTSLGFLHFLRIQMPAALRELERAVDLKPSYARAQRWLGGTYFMIGRLESGLEHLSLSVELNPGHPIGEEWYAMASLAAGNLTEAHQAARTVRRTSPNEVVPFALRRLGQMEVAKTVVQRDLSTRRGNEWEDPHERALLAVMDVAAGDTTDARTHLDKLGDEQGDPFARGVIHAALGERTAAFEAFQSMQDWGLFSTVIIRYLYPEVLGPLREDPRYHELIGEVNKTLGLNPDGSLPAERDSPVPADSEVDV